MIIVAPTEKGPTSWEIGLFLPDVDSVIGLN